ncbi:MAG: hypothetical protein EXS13_04280 [Planctomycetes bacterium]|nr:hypothetical protein [Planctomycetota bacterium]
MPEPSTLEVVIPWPREILELGFEVMVQPAKVSEFASLRRAIGLDGVVRLGPLDQRELNIALWLGPPDWRGKHVAGGVLPSLDPGEVRTWSPIELGSGVLRLAGRVVGHDSKPVVAELQLVVPCDGRVECYAVTSDGEGRFIVGSAPIRPNIVLARGRAIELLARGPAGVARVAVAEALPAIGTFRRLDVTLHPGHALRGRALDAEGKPLVCQWLSFEPMGVGLNERRWFGAEVETDADGNFAAEGFEAGEYQVRSFGKDGWRELGTMPADGAAVELRVGVAKASGS